MAFGPHGPRAPTSKPGDGTKLFFGTLGLVSLGGLLFFTAQYFGKSKLYYKKKKTFQFAHPIFFFFFCMSSSLVAGEPPKTLTKEWQEASNERAKEMNLNPITGT